MIDNKTKIILSCSSNPSNFGCKIYNYIFRKNSLNYLYVPIKTTNAKTIINTIKEFNLHGASISMPIKKKIYKYVDTSDKIGNLTNSINTIINQKSKIIGHNTDFYGFLKSIEKYSPSSVAIYGYGSVVDSIIFALRKKNIHNIYIFGKNPTKIRHKIKKYNLNSIKKSERFDLLINATPALLNKDLSRLISISKIFFDLRVHVEDNDLIKYAKMKKVKTITGLEMYKFQFLKQFELYTHQKINYIEFRNVFRKLFKNNS